MSYSRELLTKQACRDELVVYSLFFFSNNLYIYIYIYIYIYTYIHDVVKSKRRHWLAVTLSFTPCGDRQTDFYYNEEISLALYTVCLC